MQNKNLNLLYQNFSKLKVLVIGDLMLDNYVFGDCTRISPEAPIPVFLKKKETFTLGGSGNTALNLKKLGLAVTVFGATGKDDEGQKIKKLLQTHKISTEFLPEVCNFQTTTKQRFVSQGQQLFRFDTESKLPENLPFPKINWKNFDFAVVSDYGKGVVNSELMKILIASQKPVYFAPKEKIYSNVTLLVANKKEISQITQKNFTEKNAFKVLSKIQKSYKIKNVVVTLAEKGVCFLENEKLVVENTQAKEIFDVTGAGDTFLAVLAATHFLTQDLDFACKLANLGAGQVVSKQGTSVVDFTEFLPKTKILDLESALILREKMASKTLVFTNGCFDILHAGHVQFLRKAKELGDFLLVAVNSDASIKTLKGKTRPINLLKDRLEMLSALEFVDGILAFEEETPQELIEKLKPDFLVKGEDYKLLEIVGKDFVESYGGKVVIFNFETKTSTSKILEKI
ncbi:D-glycero-beta-D-manno-heptose 1-phosphate adenylyltransferase [bacterium]|nr:D-glycero-beta-D-manno-heptose 1-phosphate adenylyltransferase [bacterium]